MSELFLTLAMFERCSNLCLSWVDVSWVELSWVKFSFFKMHIDTHYWLVLKCLGPNTWEMNMSELLLALAMCWKSLKYVLHEIYLYVDVTSVFLHAREHTPLTIVEIPWSHFSEEWTCLVCSWLLLCCLFWTYIFANVPLLCSVFCVLKQHDKYKDRSVFLTQCEFPNTDCISSV